MSTCTVLHLTPCFENTLARLRTPPPPPKWWKGGTEGKRKGEVAGGGGERKCEREKNEGEKV